MFSRTPLLRLCCALGLLAGPLAAQQPATLSGTARSQIALLQAEKTARSAVQRKMDSRLVHLVKKHRGERFGAGLERLEANVKAAADGRELVDIDAIVSEALLAHLRASGAEIVASVPRFNAVRARVPAASIEALAARADVRWVKPAARAMTHVGSQTSAGDQTHAADAARAMFGVTGRGARVGVLSDSVDFLTNVQASGDLPAVTVLPGQDGLGNTGEGTAMLEIVHDLAPGAELFFATAFISQAQFAQNILDLRKAGCDIIVDDVIYFDESPFMDGPLARAVEAVVADGALYFSSAGNEGNENDNTSGTWEGDFADGGAADAALGVSGRLHSFGANAFNVANTSGAVVTLFWADPYGGSANDYDLYVLDSTGSFVIAASTNLQNGTQDPFEIVGPPNAGDRIVIVKADDAQPRYLQLSSFGGRLSVSTAGSCTGHAAAAGALAVAAVNAATSSPNPFSGGAANPVEPFSSDGPRRVFFHADGTPITPGDFSATGGEVRQKPDIAAADGVATATPGFNPFFGTSAAAPHAAAVAALLWSYNRTLTPAQIRTALTGTALDIEAAGVDRDSGAGIVMASAAIQSVAPGPVVEVVNATVTAESFLPATMNPDPGETVTISLTLRNVGGAAGPISATLLAVGGVSAPSAAQDFGTLAADGGEAARDFTFTANGAAGGALDATFAVRSGAAFLGNLVVPFTLGAAQGPGADLLVSVSPIAPLSVGDTTTLNVVVFNSGALQADNVTLDGTLPGLLVPFAGTLTQGSGFISGQQVLIDFGTIAAGDSATMTLDCDAKAAGTAPVFFVTGQAAVDNNDANNSGSASVTVGRANLAPAQLIVSTTPGTGTDASTIDATQPIYVDFTVTNPGTGPASQPFVTQLFLDGELVRTFSQQLPLAAGASAQTLDALLGPLAPGPHTLLVRTDAGGAVPESDEGDNELVRNFTVQGPNLAPGTIVVSKTTGTTTNTPVFQTSDSVFLDYSLTNNGVSATGVATTVEVFLDGNLVTQMNVPADLGAGQSTGAVDVALGSLAPGTHTIRVVLDATDALAETDETDNEFTRDFIVNSPPTISDLGDVTFDEDLPPGGIAFTVGDAETPAESLMVSAASTRPSFLVSVSGSGANRMLLLSPMLNANGMGTITVTVRDDAGGATSESFMLTVNPVNDPPTFVAGPSLIVDEDAGAQSFVGWASSISAGPNNEAGQSVSFTVGNDHAALFSVAPALAPNGTLSFTPAPDANGLATLTISAMDSGGGNDTSPPQTVTVTITPVNDPPTFLAGADVTVSEDSGPVTIAPWATAISAGPPDESGQTVSFAVSNDRSVLFAAQPAIDAAGTLTFTPGADANGQATVTVFAHDSGGPEQSAVATFTIAVSAVNDPPAFTLGGDLAVARDAGTQSIANFASDISAGPADEAGQTVSFAVVADEPGLFLAAPAIGVDGTLTFTPEPTASGETTVTVTATDSEGAGSAAQTFEIAVTSFVEEVGSYAGLASPLAAGGSSVAQAGTIAVRFAPSGRATGRLLLGGQRHPFKGFVDHEGRVRFGAVPNVAALELRRRGQTPLRLNLRLEVAGENGQLTGAVSDGAAAFATIVAERAGYDRRRPALAPLAGRFTALLPHRTGANNGVAADAYPQGDGVAALTIGRSGVAVLRGTLADGTKLSAAAPLSAGNRWPFFAATERRRGAIGGFVEFVVDGATCEATGTALLWHKPANARASRYPDGWPGGVLVDFSGATFTATPGTSALPGLGASDSDGNARFTASDGGLASPLVKALRIELTNRIDVLAPAEDALRLSLQRRTGLVRGRFTPPGERPVPVRAVVLQSEARIGGFFAGSTESGAVAIVPDDSPGAP